MGTRPTPIVDRFEPASTKAVRLYASPGDDILTGRVRPGTALLEHLLADHYGISHMPVHQEGPRLFQVEQTVLRWTVLRWHVRGDQTLRRISRSRERSSHE